MPQIDCICGIFALHGIILHQGQGFVKGFFAFFLQNGKIRRNTKKLSKKRVYFLCILPFMKPLLRRAESRFAEPRSFPEMGRGFMSYFLYFTKSMVKAAKGGGRIYFGLCEFVILSADSRCAESRSSLRGRTDCHFLHRAKSNQKARGAKPCDPRFKSPVDTFLKRK